MKRLRVALAQINTTVGDFEGNVERCLASVRQAEAYGSDLVIFPELTLTGYPPEDLLLRPGFLRKGMHALADFAPEVGNICAVVGFADWNGSAVYNAAAVIRGGEVRCVYHKMFLPNYGVFDEKRYFSPGDAPLSFLLGDVSIGITICEDIWVEEGPHCELGPARHADVIINISASPFHAGKNRQREELLQKRSLAAQTPIVYVNLVGGQDELVFDGGSLVFDRRGNRVLRAHSFTEELAILDLTLDTPLHDDSKACARIPGILCVDAPPVSPPLADELSEEKEILEALVIGTRDYIRKNGFRQVVIGLSGGVDSALVAAIAVRALGKENVTGVTMPSQYTSEGTYTDAGQLARNLDVRFIELPIRETFDSFLHTLGDVFRDMPPDVTEENLQARIRGALLMALSNKFGWLVLTTGNKSEIATGYCTLYGDMAGGFAVIKDVPKTMVYRICRLMNEEAGREIIPESILVRPPTAELRPNQKDQDSLPPYEILDPILKLYVEDDRSVEDIVAQGFDGETVRRVVRLCDISEYKRRQAPPGVKITPRAFGRDRRLPISNRFRDIGNGGISGR
ncbi:MAG: NAD+ synthase [Candidatus Latescibacterota bacterium]